jgi:hypothetical protein
MASNFSAVGTFADDGNPITVEVPSDTAQVIAKLNEIVAKYDTGDVLEEDDKQIVRAYLPAIGADETGLSAENAYVGSGSFDFERSVANLDLHIKGKLGCRGVGEGRIEASLDTLVEKTGGSGRIDEIGFNFVGIGFGVGPTGVMKVIYKREHAREFPGKDAAAASFFDRYTLTQWGFYYTTVINLKTDSGVITIQ